MSGSGKEAEEEVEDAKTHCKCQAGMAVGNLLNINSINKRIDFRSSTWATFSVSAVSRFSHVAQHFDCIFVRKKRENVEQNVSFIESDWTSFHALTAFACFLLLPMAKGFAP